MPTDPTDTRPLNLTAAANIELVAASDSEPTPLPRFQMTAYTGGPMRIAGYQRADGPVVNVPATKGKTDYEVGDASYSGATLRAHVIDFLITAEVLGFDPQAGDVIVADGRRYEVMDLAGQGAWRWSDPYHTTYRIHTKDVAPGI